MLRTTIKTTTIALALALSATATLAADHTVSISNFAFAPANIEVAAGDTITFTNTDGAPHTATALDGSFDTGRLNTGDSGTVTIAAAGTVDFKCNFHPNMTGAVTAK